jgi:hypothetical protein
MTAEMVVDLRPLAVDKLVTLPAEAVVQRRQRAEELVAHFEQRCADLRVRLEEAQTLYRFLVQERDNAVLALRLQANEVVRVICPTCKGSGLKPTDVLAGQIHRKSAFETVGEPVRRIEPSDVPETERCSACGGKRWVLMDRFCG